MFPDDFAYYLLKDDKTLVMISAVKSLNTNFKYDITSKKLELYPTTGKFDFIISSFSKDCGHYKFDDNYKCNIYMPRQIFLLRTTVSRLLFHPNLAQ